jgi:hypothetical protein
MKASAAKAPRANAVSILGQMADELGALEKELAPWAPKIARVELLRKSIRVSAEEQPPEKEYQIAGARFVVVAGPKANQRSIDFPALLKRISARTFAAFATCTLTALEQNVASELFAAVVKTAPTGPRPLKTFERAAS